MTAVSRSKGRWALALAATTVVVGVLLVTIHTPPARRAVLDRAIAILADRLNIALRTGALRYNLFALRVTLTDVVLASTTAPETPFLTAEVIEVDLPWSALYGQFSIERVGLQIAAVTIVRNADGTSNLPPSQKSTGDPAPIPIDTIDIAKLALRVRDEPSGVELYLPLVEGRIERDRGSLRLVQAGSLTRNGESGEISKLEGGVRFDGRVLRVDGFSISTGDVNAQVDGRVALFVPSPGINLQMKGQVDLRRATRWAMREPRPDGGLAVDGGVEGPFDALTGFLHVRSDAVIWQRVSATDLTGDVRFSPGGLAVGALEASVAGGRVRADATLKLDAQEVSATVMWEDVDASRLVRMIAPDTALRPAARTRGSASVDGSMNLARMKATLRVALQATAARAGELPVTGAARLIVSEGRWMLDGEHRVASASMRTTLSGRIDGESLPASTLSGALQVGRTELRPLLGALSAAGVASAPQVEGGAVKGTVTLAGTLGAPRFQAAVSADAVAVSRSRGLAADLTASGTARRLAFNVTVSQAAANQLVAAGTFAPQSARLEVKVTGRLTDLAQLAPDAPVAGTVDVSFEGSGPVDAMSGRGTVTASRLTYDRVALGTLESIVDLDAAVARVTAALEDFGARAAATVALKPPHETRVELQVTEADLGRMTRDLELSVLLSGKVSLAVQGSGALEAWQRGSAAVEVSSLEARAGDLPLRLTRPAKGIYADGIATVSLFEATLGETQLSGGGALPVLKDAPPVTETDTLRLMLTGDLAQTLSAVRATRLVELPPVRGTGPLALRSRIGGSALAPEVAADLELGPGTVAFGEWPPVTRLRLRARVEDGWLELREAGAEWQGSETTADGRLPLRLLEPYLPAAVVEALPAVAGSASLNAGSTSLTPRVLEPFLDADTVSQLEGSVDASLRLESPTLRSSDVRGELRLDRLNLRIAGLPVAQQEPTRIVADGGFARVAAWDWTGEGATLGVRGQVRLEDQQAALLANGRVDLRTLTPFLRGAGVSTGGLLEPRLSVTGPIRDPRIDGDVRMTGGEVRMAAPRVVATDLSAHAVLSRTTGHITSLTGTLNGGALTGSGEFAFGDPAAPVTARLSAAVGNMAMNTPEGLRTEVNADLALGVEVPPDAPAAGTLTGTVTILRGIYREPLALTMRLLGTMRGQQLGALTVGETDRFTNRLKLDVRVLTDEEIVVDNNIGRVHLYGDLRVIGTAASPSLSGRAELRPDGRLFLGRSIYTLESGTIDFANPVVIEPILNIKATTRVAGEDISLSIAGTPEDPTVEFTSSNQDLTDADIGALLVTGRTLDELGTADAEFIGRELVLGNLSGEILGFAGRAAGLDSIRLGGVDPSLVRRDPTAVASEIDPTSRLTFGKSLGDQVELTYSQSLVESDAQTWIVDYLPVRQLDLRVVSDDDDLRSYEFRHDISIGGSRRVRGGAAPSARPREQLVTSVTFGRNVASDEPALRRLLRLEPGERFDFLEWQLDRDRIERFYEERAFREVRVTARREDAEGGVALAYDVVHGPKTAIDVTGYELGRDTMQAVERAWSASVFDGFLIEEAGGIVRNAVADAGYLQAVIDVAVTPGETKTLAIRIMPGPRTERYQVRIEGPDASVNAAVEEWLRSRGIDRAVVRDPAMAEREVGGYLRSLGRLRAAVRTGAVRFEDAVARLPLTVEPGALFTVGEVVVRSTHRLEESVQTITGLEAGTPYDAAAVDAARDSLAATYRRAGFVHVRVTAAPQVGDAQVSLVFEVDEGPRQVLREIAVEGNRSINADVVLRRLELSLGEPLGPEAWLQARRRVFDTGLFRRVDIVTEPMPSSGDSATAGEQPVRLKVVLEEWPALRLRYGFQVAEEKAESEVEGRDLSPGLTVDVTRRTLFGRAVSLGIAGEVRQRDQQARTFLTAPTMFGWPVESALSLGWTRRRLAGSTRIDERAGVSGEQRIPVGRNVRLSYGYQLEKSSTETLNDPVLGTFTVRVQTARLTAAGTRDTRDDPTNSTRGSLFSLSLEYAPEALGSEFRFIRMLGQAYHFRRWRDVVFASAARIGSVRPFGGQELLDSERFFAGGARTVRGAPEEGLGPSDFFGPIGGAGLLVLNQEVRFPLYRWVRGVAFVDAGNVFPRVSNIGLGSLTGAMGAGLRVTTPFGILRGDYGRLWSPVPNQPAGRFTFGLGHTF